MCIAAVNFFVLPGALLESAPLLLRKPVCVVVYSLVLRALHECAMYVSMFACTCTISYVFENRREFVLRAIASGVSTIVRFLVLFVRYFRFSRFQPPLYHIFSFFFLMLMLLVSSSSSVNKKIGCTYDTCVLDVLPCASSSSSNSVEDVQMYVCAVGCADLAPDCVGLYRGGSWIYMYMIQSMRFALLP